MPEIVNMELVTMVHGFMEMVVIELGSFQCDNFTRKSEHSKVNESNNFIDY